MMSDNLMAETDAATDSLEAEIDKWVEREIASGNMVPDFWDDQDTSGRLAEYLVNAGYRRAT